MLEEMSVLPALVIGIEEEGPYLNMGPITKTTVAVIQFALWIGLVPQPGIQIFRMQDLLGEACSAEDRWGPSVRKGKKNFGQPGEKGCKLKLLEKENPNLSHSYQFDAKASNTCPEPGEGSQCSSREEATRMLQGLKLLCSGDRLGELGGVQTGEEKAPGRPQSLCQYLKGLQERWTGVYVMWQQ
ncbi:hypothetical protein DUI87_11148 [Hirundo rustica rustica]|uniref:Uncharacterized protein n=1 Tax=Hirundo rustica rustica TaxID=333673 RepID=A0A3M0KG41_HIRRU|nr:hypothetical protein DUI87_11148 [Hirundo rustica rustica]